MTFRLVSVISRNETGILRSQFTRAINRITWPRRDNKFLFECWKISRESTPFELCLINLKLQTAAQRRFVFVECCVVKLLSCVPWLSRTFSTFSDHSWVIWLGHVYISARVRRFASVTEIIKYVEKLQLFACLVFCRTLCETVYKFQASCFDELSFFPRAEGRFYVLCLPVGGGRKISEFQVTVCYYWQSLFSFTEVQVNLCWRMLCFKAP